MVASGSGNVQAGQNVYVITADNYNGGGGDSVISGYETSYQTKTATASNSSNFIFVGKGWGHGVGLSQYGVKDLADFGYSYDKILAAYVPDATIIKVSQVY